MLLVHPLNHHYLPPLAPSQMDLDEPVSGNNFVGHFLLKPSRIKALVFFTNIKPRSWSLNSFIHIDQWPKLWHHSSSSTINSQPQRPVIKKQQVYLGIETWDQLQNSHLIQQIDKTVSEKHLSWCKFISASHISFHWRVHLSSKSAAASLALFCATEILLRVRKILFALNWTKKDQT